MILFSMSVTCDGFIIGLSYGARRVKISFINNVIVGGISCLGTMAGMYLGRFFDNLIDTDITKYMGSVLLLAFGLFMLYQAIQKYVKKDDVVIVKNAADLAETFDADNSKVIELSEALLLGAFLCVNNFGLGVGAALSGLNIVLTSMLCFVLSVAFIELGIRVTYNCFSAKIVKYSEFIASFIIILLALYQLTI